MLCFMRDGGEFVLGLNLNLKIQSYASVTRSSVGEGLQLSQLEVYEVVL